MRTLLASAHALLAAALLPFASPAAAQNGGVAVSAAGIAHRAEHRIRYLGMLHDQSGTWWGAEGQIRAGRVAVRLSGVTGKLTGDTSVTNPDRDIRVSTASLGLQPTSWLELGVDLTARRVATQASTVVMRLFGGHAGLRIPLGLDGLAGHASAVYYAATDVTGDESLSLALGGELGFTYAPPRGAVLLRLAYRFERYDYAEGTLGSARLEQVRALVIGVGLQLMR